MKPDPVASSRCALGAAVALGLVVFAPTVAAQQRMAFSVNWVDPSISSPDCAAGIPITEGDIVLPCARPPGIGPLPPSRVLITAGFVGAPPGYGLPAHATCVGHAGGTPCGVELDALSFGNSEPLLPTVPLRHHLVFSTDEYAVGMPGMPAPPRIWTETCGDLSAIAAENLVLATLRSGVPANFGHELDALDLLPAPMFDCNMNGIEDAVDIAIGASSDVNLNGIPDECETGTTISSCCCHAALAPCGNADPSAGCRNSTAAGGSWLSARARPASAPMTSC